MAFIFHINRLCLFFCTLFSPVCRPLCIMATVQYPEVVISPLNLDLGDLVIGLEHQQEFIVKNKAHLPTVLSWPGTVEECQHLSVVELRSRSVTLDKLEQGVITINFRPLLLVFFISSFFNSILKFKFPIFCICFAFFFKFFRFFSVDDF